jgi:hypothetical protein
VHEIKKEKGEGACCLLREEEIEEVLFRFKKRWVGMRLLL